MQILFDPRTPAPLRHAFVGHDVATVFEIDSPDLSNGELLAKAEARFATLVTTDQNLRYQQNLTGRQFAILVLPTTSWPLLQPHASEIALAATALTAGEDLEFALPTQ